MKFALAAHKSAVETLRDGLIDPAASTAPSPCWPDLVTIALDREVFALPFFSTLGQAARHAAELVVVLEFFGCRVTWAAVVREHCYRFRAAVSVEPDPRYCDALDVLIAAVLGFKGVSSAGVALHWSDDYGQFGNLEHTTDPDTAARRLIEAVLEPRACIVAGLATRLLSLRPLFRPQPTQSQDVMSALYNAADRDMPCDWPLTDSDRWAWEESR